ncbi:MAG: ATP-binding cassette domain-containing protein [Chloroflexi bacterium]|nr:ATP-binding cassette domain-containing protein [Chloroflexota bacterium]
MTEPLVRVSGLTYYYQNDKEPVLRDINLEVYPGEFVLVIGPSGCGKSTLALCLNGIIPTVLGGRIKGRVYVEGVDTRESTVYELGTKIGIVFQDPDAQLCNLHVDEEVAFGPANLMMDKEVILRRVDKALQDVGESEIRHKLIYEISGGQKKRVAIASILAMEPEIIIFDEPTANLDPLGAVQVFDLMKKINQEQGITIVVVEHNVDSVMCHADRLILMGGDGTIRYNGSPRELMREQGRFILDDLGLRIPQVCELGLMMEERGLSLNPFPLTVNEAVEAISLAKDRLEFLPEQAEVTKVEEPQPVIQTDGLDFTYPDGTHAIRDVSLEINRGDVVSIIGKNGSGKTTLTSLFVGLNKPTSGKGTVCGLDLATATIRELAGKVGYVFQYPEHQFVEDTVYKEVAFSLKAQKQSPEEVGTRVNRVLELMGLEQMKDKHPLRLSMGQKRRLSVATMLILNTDILVLDEPTTGQDRKNIDNIMEIMREANEAGTTIILITHDMNLVARYSNRIMVMEKGELVFYGSKSDFFRDFSIIRSSTLVLPEIYELAQILRERGICQVPQVSTVEGFVNAVEVR